MTISDVHHSVLEPGSKQRWALHLAESLLGPLTVPLPTCRGRQSGPVLLAVAGVHGDEFEGMEAIRQAFAQLDPAQMRGTFLGVPIANPWAYDAQTRASPAAVDGKNLARVFAGQEHGSPTERLASRFFQSVRRNLGAGDLLVDLHSGGTRYRYLPMVGYRDFGGPARAPSLEAARHVGIDRLWILPGTPGPLNAETLRAGIPTIGAEVRDRAAASKMTWPPMLGAASTACATRGCCRAGLHHAARWRPGKRAGCTSRSTACSSQRSISATPWPKAGSWRR